MGKRYLMRLGKNPFEPVNGFSSYERNTLGRNNGNLIYGAASHKLLSTHDTEVVANHYLIEASMADQVNSEYDGFVLPLANAFRPSFEPELQRTTEFIERLTIPFLMLSGGAQLPLDGNPAALGRMEPTIRRFARAVLEKSSALSVRGELTAEYLKSLGFNDVVVVGCPSMTMNGPGYRVEIPDSLPRGASIAYNIEPLRPDGAALIADAEANYRATYFPQDEQTLEYMLWGTRPYSGSDTRLPVEPGHRQFAQLEAEYHLDASRWIHRLGQMQFSFGLRLHGNVAAILGGTPAMLLVHDGRTKELARYHEIPHIEVGRGADPPTTVAELFSMTDFTAFNRGYDERFERMSNYIHNNGFGHIFEPGQEQARANYEQRLERTAFPEPQKPIWIHNSDHNAQLVATLQARHQQMVTANERLQRQVDKLHHQQKLLNTRHKQLQTSLEHTDQRLMEAKLQLKSVSQKATRTQQRLDRVLRLPAKARRVLTPWRRPT